MKDFTPYVHSTDVISFSKRKINDFKEYNIHSKILLDILIKSINSVDTPVIFKKLQYMYNNTLILLDKMG